MGTGGRRYGAGRPGWRRKCEQCLRLDIRALARKGFLKPGSYFGWQWTRDEEPCGSIGLSVSDAHVTFTYQRKPAEFPAQDFCFQVWIERSRCHLGGSRPWFLCPRCRNRCAILYGLARDGRFGCRICMRLAYTSEAEDTLSRLRRKQWKLEARLGENHVRPPRMRHKTYERIHERIGEVEEAKDENFIASASRLLRRLDRL